MSLISRPHPRWLPSTDEDAKVPSDGTAMGRYLERYVYDAVGNFLSMQHRGTDLANPAWTRAYGYNEASQIEPGKQSNRLTSTTTGATAETYSAGGNGYDAHGSMLRMPHLQAMHWDFKDQLQMTQRQAVNASDEDGVQRHGERTWYVYDAGGQRVRKVTELPSGQIKDERVYLGAFEVYRRHGSNPLVRETLHLMDDKKRIALVETRTQGSDPAPQQLIRYQFGNHLGSASLELDDQAQIISCEEYTPYGSTSYQAVRNQTETPKRYRYTGKERDDETGLAYHDARYYAPWLGRWISSDPIDIKGGVNVYSYVINNPLNFHDPTGNNEDPPPIYDCGDGTSEIFNGEAYVPGGVSLKAIEISPNCSSWSWKGVGATAGTAIQVGGAVARHIDSYAGAAFTALGGLSAGIVFAPFSDRDEKYLTPALLFAEHVLGISKDRYLFVEGDLITDEAKKFPEIDAFRRQIESIPYGGGEITKFPSLAHCLRDIDPVEYVNKIFPEDAAKHDELHALLGSYTVGASISSINNGVATVSFTIVDKLRAGSTTHLKPDKEGNYTESALSDRKTGPFKTSAIYISWSEKIQTSGKGSGVALPWYEKGRFIPWK